MRITGFGAALGLLVATMAIAADPAHEAAGRLLVLLHGVGAEYAGAFDDQKRLVRPIELAEVRALLHEAAARVDALGEPLADEVRDAIASLSAACASEAFVDTVATRVDATSAAITRATGVTTQLLPTRAPAAARGALLFAENCARCHGTSGAGDGPAAATLEPKPANFRDPAFIRGETPEDFFTVVTLGRQESGMPAWGEVFSVDERWDLVAFLRSLARAPDTVERGNRVFREQCAPCHGPGGSGDGKEAVSLPVAVPDFGRPGALIGRADVELLDLLDAHGAPSAFHDFGALPPDDRMAVVTFLRALTLDRDATLGDGRSRGPAEAFGRVRRGLARAVDASRHGDGQALALVTDAYLQFEPLERAIGARDPGAVRRVEQAFLDLRAATESGDAATGAGATERVLAALADAEAVLSARSSGGATVALLLVSALALPTLVGRHLGRRK